ncbi:MAG: hypothetical protein V1944_00295 [Candidatus Aenigmatarchaeota archaeon]
MKGQLHFGPEIIIRSLGFIFIAISLVATLFALYNYSITYEGRPELRQLIDFSENYMSSTCLVYEDHGTYYKGIFDKSKLDNDVKGCITFSKPVSVFIRDEKGGRWSFYNNIGGQKLSYPIVVKYPNEFVPGTMEVFI